MSHHSTNNSLTEKMRELENLAADKPAEEVMKKLRQVEAAKKHLDKTLGPTGTYPAGRLVAQDEGGLMFGVTRFNGRVILDFGKPVQSIGFTRNDALELAKVLRAHAKQCPPIIGEAEPVD